MKRDDDILGKREDHPSYGMIGASRYTCTPPQNLFGSSVRHHAGVAVRIHQAHKARSLSDDRYYSDGLLVEIEMSAAQWGEFISSANIGDGVPCTLHYLNPQLKEISNGQIPPCPEESQRQAIHDDFKKEMEKLAAGLDELVALAQSFQTKASINKGDREQFAKLAEGLRCKISNSIPFIHSQFTEATEHTVTDAKANLEAFVTNLSRSLGDAQLKARLQGSAQNVLPELSAGVSQSDCSEPRSPA